MECAVYSIFRLAAAALFFFHVMHTPGVLVEFYFLYRQDTLLVLL